MLKSFIKILISLLLIFENSFAIDGYYDVNNTMPSHPNVDCYFVFDKLAAPECNKLYKDNNGNINKMMNDEDTFYKCLVSNCGLYKTDTSNYQEGYQYKMEILKKCALDSQDTLNYNELSKSDWFVNLNDNLANEAKVSKTQTQTRFIPFKVYKYKCPKFRAIKYKSKQRVLQYPVLCFKTSDTSLNNKIKNCLENQDSSACQNISNIDIGDYVKYVYCDTDKDGDGFPESLSPALQSSCHRSDAASLRCTENKLCSTEVKCVENGNKKINEYQYHSCDALTRNYHDYTVNTECGGQVDQYQNNPNCIRINSVTDAREKGIEYYQGNKTKNLNTPLRFIEVKDYPSSIDEMNSYHEYILYQKKNGDVKKRFVALIYPNAIYKKKSSFTALGKIFNALTGGMIAYSTGMAGASFGIKAIGAGFITKTKSIPNTIIDGILKKAVEDGYKITTNKDIKNVTFKVKTSHGLLKKKSKIYMMKAWWDSTLVYDTNLINPVSSDWIWNGYRRKNIHYNLKIGINPNDVLTAYTINANKNKFATPDVYVKEYGLTCSASQTDNMLATWKNFINASSYPIKSPSIQNMTIFLTYPSLYLFKFYNNNQLVGMSYKNFSYNNGNYPLKDLEVASNGILKNSNSSFGSKMTDLYNNTYKSTIVNNTLNDTMNLSETQTLIDNLTNSLLKTFEKRNIDEIKKQTKGFTKYSTINTFLNFWKLKYAMDYMVNNSYKNNLCYSSNNDNVPTTSGDATLSSDNTEDTFNNDLLDYKKCLSLGKMKGNDINTSLNTNTDILNLDKKRLLKLEDLTKKVYKDLTKTEISNINSYLNKKGDRYSLSTSQGTWSMSFKSKCGDYADAKLNAQTNYENSFNTFTTNNFSDKASSVANGIIALIDGHLKDVTLKYKYSVYKRTGTTKWDAWHPAKAGTYSCKYNTECWNSCATTYKCNCTINAKGKETCSNCCESGYVPCKQTSSGSCYTYGTAITSPCTAHCSGYVNGHYGSQVNACGDSECDVSNDWDKQCSANYTYYKTSENAGDADKTLTDTGSDYFDSYGSYQCDRYTLSPTGSSTKYCQTTGHDIKDFNYKNTIQSYKTWSSTAKKLNTTTANIKTLEHTWLKNHSYQDNSFVKSLWAADANGYNNIRFKLSTSTTNPIFTTASSYVKPYIKTYVTNLVKKFYKEKITYELKNSITGDSILDNYKKIYLPQMFNSAISDILGNPADFKPFNKIEIHDMLADPKSPYAINYTIETPGNLLIKNPNAINIIMLSFPNVRKYRCYDNFKTCSFANKSNCTLDSFLNYNDVYDFTGKKVPTLRKEVYKCKTAKTVNTCKKWQTISKCYNMDLNNSYVEFDDNDFSKDFGKTVGENLAFNQAIYIFGAKQYKCEKGLFTDFGWMTDPAFLLQAALVVSNYIPSNTASGSSLTSWMQGATSSSKNTCSNAWLACMAKNKSTFSSAVTTGITSAAQCDSQVRQLPTCRSFAGVSPLAQEVNQLMNNPIVSSLSSPLGALAAQVAYQLAFNTFDKCNQCINSKCAMSHKPKSAMTLFKMDGGKKIVREGAEYGLGPNFKQYGQCYYKNTKCAEKILGRCIRRTYNYCCYNTKLASSLAAQMYEQLGFTYENNGCKAIEITDLPKIDFSPCPDGTIPSPSNKCINYKEIEDYINSKINWNLKGSFDMNKVIQALMNEGSD